jgi:hypothetical protein
MNFTIFLLNSKNFTIFFIEILFYQHINVFIHCFREFYDKKIINLQKNNIKICQVRFLRLRLLSLLHFFQHFSTVDCRVDRYFVRCHGCSMTNTMFADNFLFQQQNFTLTFGTVQDTTGKKVY